MCAANAIPILQRRETEAWIGVSSYKLSAKWLGGWGEGKAGAGTGTQESCPKYPCPKCWTLLPATALPRREMGSYCQGVGNADQLG